jgi:hypothetical protein
MLMNNNPQQLTEQAIPCRLVIGVTGHRSLEGESRLSEEIGKVIEAIRKMLPPMKHTPLVLTVLSPLAEGADRLVAREVSKQPGARLEVVLPMKKEEYLKDFQGENSRNEFEEWLSRAQMVKELPGRPTRNEAYDQVGRYVVDHCDVLLALWNGQPAAGQGGTAEVVEYARRKKCPLFWIHTADSLPAHYEPGNGLDSRPFRELDQYNSETVDSSELKVGTQKAIDRLRAQARQADFTSPLLDSWGAEILSQYVHADLLALRYQHRHFRAGSVVYTFAATAVFVVAFQAFFAPRWTFIALLEVLLMAGVLATLWFESRQHWHRRWVDYRFLAERLRSAIFTSAAGLDLGSLKPPRHLSLAYTPRDWMVRAFASIRRQLPRVDITTSLKLESLRHFVLNAWLDDQILYFQSTSQRHYRRHRQLVFASNLLFALTFIAAALHAWHGSPKSLHSLLPFMAIVCPAIGSTLAAIRTHREYLRNARRASEMIHHLEEIKEQMKEARDLDHFLPLMREAEETMLHENEDWRVVVRFHELEPTA